MSKRTGTHAHEVRLEVNGVKHRPATVAEMMQALKDSRDRISTPLTECIFWQDGDWWLPEDFQ